jgi:polar amino acid transport system substrate-binding protein
VAEKGPADVILSRLVKQAVLVRAPGLPAALEMLKSGKADAFAGNKATLFELSDQLPGSRVLDGRFSVERFAMAIPRGRDIGTLYVRKFVEDAKAQSLVKRALERAGARGALVAQPE